MKPKSEKTKKDILKVYAALTKKLGVYPSRSQIINEGVSRDRVRYHFGTVQMMKIAALKAFPDAFGRILDENLVSKESIDALRQKIAQHKRFVITTAVVGCKVDKKFYASLKTYCRENDALLLVLISADPAAKAGWNVDPVLHSENIVFADMSLNSNIFISTIKLSAKHIDPITGLGRIGQRDGTFIFASPKQRLKVVATSNSKLPHALMTTGAVTKAQYDTERFMSERTAYIADHDHVMGAIAVELKDDRIFFFRQLQADASGGFNDLNTYYRGDSSTPTQAEAVVVGDYHSGETDPDAKRAVLELVDLVKPKRMFLHDLFNGTAINHHEKHKKISRAMDAEENKLSLKDELLGVAKDLNELSQLVEETNIVPSNHDDFLAEYLEDGRFMKEPNNTKISLRLAEAMIDGKNPLQFGVESLGLTKSRKIQWLQRDEDYKISGIECGAHGDRGSNGARGSINSLEAAYGDVMFGHTHTPEILRGAWSVGTTSILNPRYKKGASSWLHCSGTIYSNGNRQLIISIDGEWRLKDGKVKNQSGKGRSERRDQKAPKNHKKSAKRVGQAAKSKRSSNSSREGRLSSEE